MNTNDGGPAFPRTGFYSEEGEATYDTVAEPGMSLRDWFAGIALSGMLAWPGGCPPYTDSETERANMAEIAYIFADAMIQEREKKP